MWELPGELRGRGGDARDRRATDASTGCTSGPSRSTSATAGRPAGGGHLGLQHHPQYPGQDRGQLGRLRRRRPGSCRAPTPAWPAPLDNPHTRNLAWQPGRPYRLAVGLAPPDEQPAGGATAWRGTVTDLVDGHDGRRAGPAAPGQPPGAPDGLVGGVRPLRARPPSRSAGRIPGPSPMTGGRCGRPRPSRTTSAARTGAATTPAPGSRTGTLVQRTCTERRTPRAPASRCRSPDGRLDSRL